MRVLFNIHAYVFWMLDFKISLSKVLSHMHVNWRQPFMSSFALSGSWCCLQKLCGIKFRKLGEIKACIPKLYIPCIMMILLAFLASWRTTPQLDFWLLTSAYQPIGDNSFEHSRHLTLTTTIFLSFRLWVKCLTIAKYCYPS